jgi:diadenosine tetraphosphate (Ap4A) HIT family hydrolase
MQTRTWPEDWEDRVAGVGCPMCANQGREDNGYGVRVLEGEFADVFLQRVTPLAGYAVAIWKHGHVVEPTDLDRDASIGFGQEVLDAATAIKTEFEPAKLNLLTLGNSIPHLHTHILPRYLDDPVPGHPLPWGLIEAAGSIPEVEFQQQVGEIRGLVGPRGR